MPYSKEQFRAAAQWWADQMPKPGNEKEQAVGNAFSMAPDPSQELMLSFLASMNAAGGVFQMNKENALSLRLLIN